MAENDFSFWNKSDVQDDELKKGKKPGKDIQRAVIPVFPKKLSVEWIREQLPAEFWENLHHNCQCVPETIYIMSEYARRTPSKRAIAVRAGLHERIWSQWEERAQNGEQPYLLWYQCMAYALSELEEELLDNIRGAAMSDWKAATWMLGKINKAEFSDSRGGSNTVDNRSGDNSTNIQIEGDKLTVNSLSRDDAARISEIFQEIGAFSKPEALESGEVVDGEVVPDSEESSE